MESIVASVKSMLSSHPEIAQDKTMIVNFNAFNDSSVDFFIYTFTKTTEWVAFHEIKQAVLLEIAAIIDRHGAEMRIQRKHSIWQIALAKRWIIKAEDPPHATDAFLSEP